MLTVVSLAIGLNTIHFIAFVIVLLREQEQHFTLFSVVPISGIICTNKMTKVLSMKGVLYC